MPAVVVIYAELWNFLKEEEIYGRRLRRSAETTKFLEQVSMIGLEEGEHFSWTFTTYGKSTLIVHQVWILCNDVSLLFVRTRYYDNGLRELQ